MKALYLVKDSTGSRKSGCWASRTWHRLQLHGQYVQPHAKDGVRNNSKLQHKRRHKNIEGSKRCSLNREINSSQVIFTRASTQVGDTQSSQHITSSRNYSIISIIYIYTRNQVSINNKLESTSRSSLCLCCCPPLFASPCCLSMKQTYSQSSSSSTGAVVGTGAAASVVAAAVVVGRTRV